MISPRSFRTTELAKELAQQGHEVVVYIPFKNYDYSDFARKNDIRIKNLGTLKFKGIKLKGNRLEMFLRRVIRRVLGLLFEYPYIELMFKVPKSIKRERGHDLLVSIAVPYPIHWGIAKIWRDDRRIADCWIADCGDPYMGDTTDSFRKLFYFKYLEKWFCRKADYITVPFDGAISAYYPEFHHKIRIIPQGFKIGDLKIPDYKKTLDYPVFGYSGSFIPGRRDPRTMLEFLSKCDRNYKFIVYTSQPGVLLPFKNFLNEKLEIRKYIPREELLIVLSGMDFLINIDNNTNTQLPSKLIDYAIAGRPVLNISSETDLSEILEFMDGNFSKKMNLEPGKNYNITEVAKKFISLQTEA